MAQIIEHPNAVKHPVAQKNGPGRYPKNIIRLLWVRREKEWKERKAMLAQQEVDHLRSSLAITEQVIHNLRYEIILATQKTAQATQQIKGARHV